MVGPGQPIRPFWVRWGGGGWVAWLDGEFVELDRCGLLFSKQAFFRYYFNYGHPAGQPASTV